MKHELCERSDDEGSSTTMAGSEQVASTPPSRYVALVHTYQPPTQRRTYQTLLLVIKKRIMNESKEQVDGMIKQSSSSSLPGYAVDEDDTGYDLGRDTRIHEKCSRYEKERAKQAEMGKTSVSSSNHSPRRNKQPDEPLRQPSSGAASATTTSPAGSTPGIEKKAASGSRRRRQRRARSSGKTAATSAAGPSSSESVPGYVDVPSGRKRARMQTCMYACTGFVENG